MPVPSSFNSSVEAVSYPIVGQGAECELQSYITTLLSAQLRLARSSRAKTTYCMVLKQRMLIVQRILYAFQAKYHVKDKVNATS